MISRTATVGSSVGLHARPAAKLAEAVDAAGIDVTLKHGEDEADASSALEIMTLGAQHGDQLIVETDDDSAADKLDQIVALIESDLDKE